ncbi:hypothetical protein Pelo_4368 [Pelomyxa schiedti]|nr:hypothetical protein Pelo_4368 [Pelomyxa schiedti]
MSGDSAAVNASAEARLSQSLDTIIKEGKTPVARGGNSRQMGRQPNSSRNRHVAGMRANSARKRLQNAARGYTVQPIQTNVEPRMPVTQVQQPVPIPRRRTVLIKKSHPLQPQQQIPTNVFNIQSTGRQPSIQIRRKAPQQLPPLQRRPIREERVLYVAPRVISDPYASSIPPRRTVRTQARRPTLVSYSSRPRFGDEVFSEQPAFTTMPNSRPARQNAMVVPVQIPTAMPVVFKYMPTTSYQPAYNYDQLPQQPLPRRPKSSSQLGRLHPLQRVSPSSGKLLQPVYTYSQQSARSPRQKFPGYRY